MEYGGGGGNEDVEDDGSEVSVIVLDHEEHAGVLQRGGLQSIP